MDSIVDRWKNSKAGVLVGHTHMEGGAWYKTYYEDDSEYGMIKTDDILEEYHYRQRFDV